MTGGKPNRLIHEKSPYLLQHAHNPVDWYPWGVEAFERARAEDRPVFLSIGYSTCHWCHVMARESFEDERVAALLNADFVSIKVDREERPDIDMVYMEVALALMGTGGWPLTIVMTPEKKPFFTATYVPRESGLGLIGMLELLPRIASAWKEKREEILTAGDRITILLNTLALGSGGRGDARDVVAGVVDDLKAGFDPEHGGFGGAPKFPSPPILLLLLRTYRRTGERDLLAMAEKTLVSMHAGGMYDHVGYGFHRYATDTRWRVPHFEKMLYDQALLSIACAEAFLATGKALYRRIAEETLEYMRRDLGSPEGAFFCGEDAESGGREGAYYLWTWEDLLEILTAEESAAVTRYYGVCWEGNIPERARTGKGGGRGENILFMADPGFLPPREGSPLSSALGKMRLARGRRPRPARDEKILTDWNGLAMAALAVASRAFRSPGYLEASQKAAEFILSRLVTPGGRVYHCFEGGQAEVAGLADDYACLSWGLLELHRATLDTRFLERAAGLTDALIGHFLDPEEGGFFSTPDDGERLVARLKPVHDGFTPAANSLALANLLRLDGLTGRTRYLDIARDLTGWYLRDRSSSASASAWMMDSLSLAAFPSTEVVVVGHRFAPDTLELLAVLERRDMPGQSVLLKDPSGDPVLDTLAPFTRTFTPREGKATAYVCRNHACELPVTDPGSLAGMLEIVPGTFR